MIEMGIEQKKRMRSSKVVPISDEDQRSQKIIS